uniref:Uncharacterized protein n=1 Tax=Anguilla anguilla TaxID=7936 RepID=A0A0E9VLT4_ANGAN
MYLNLNKTYALLN